MSVDKDFLISNINLENEYISYLENMDVNNRVEFKDPQMEKYIYSHFYNEKFKNKIKETFVKEMNYGKTVGNICGLYATDSKK